MPTHRMRTTGWPFSCPDSIVSFLPSMVLRRFVSFERARIAKANCVVKACRRPGVRKRRPAVLVSTGDYNSVFPGRVMHAFSTTSAPRGYFRIWKSLARGFNADQGPMIWWRHLSVLNEHNKTPPFFIYFFVCDFSRDRSAPGNQSASRASSSRVKRVFFSFQTLGHPFVRCLVFHVGAGR